MKTCKRGHNWGPPHRQCRQCPAIAKSRYQKTVPEKNKLYRAKDRKKNLTKRREYQASYMKSYTRERRKIDLNFKIAGSIRARLAISIKIKIKKGSAVVDLGCSIPELKQHLETLFQEGMNWENWSRTGWHIDHIKPLASFDLTNREQLLKACHYTNLQPLWSSDNIKKGASFG